MSIAENIREINLNLNDRETVTITKTVKRFKFGFTPTIFSHADFLPTIGDIYKKNNLAGSAICYLVTELDKYSPFIVMKQSELAVALQASEAHLSKAIKFILSLDNPVIDRVQPGVFICNPHYVWKMTTHLRNCYLDYLSEHGAKDTYTLHKGLELSRYFEQRYGGEK